MPLPLSDQLRIALNQREHNKPSALTRLIESPMLRHLLHAPHPDRRCIIAFMCILYVQRCGIEQMIKQVFGKSLPDNAKTSQLILSDLKTAVVDTNQLTQHEAIQPINNYFSAQHKRAARLFAQLYILGNWDLLLVGPSLHKALQAHWPTHDSRMNYLAEINILSRQSRLKIFNRYNHVLDRLAEQISIPAPDVIQACEESIAMMCLVMNTQMRAINQANQQLSHMINRLIILAVLTVLTLLLSSNPTTPYQTPRFEL